MKETNSPEAGYNLKKSLHPKIILIYAIMAVVLYGAIYYFFKGKQSYSGNSYPVVSPTPQESKTITVTLSAQNDSSQDGTALISEMGGKTKVNVTLTNFPKDAQPSHLHLGGCSDLGDIKFPLSLVLNGSAETLLDMDFESFKKELPLALNVHKSASDPQTYVSCGDVKI